MIRGDTHDIWIKLRTLEGQSGAHAVHYAHHGVEARIPRILRAFGGTNAIKGRTPKTAAARLAKLYGDLDHAHGFHEGNSRTLREFTRSLAASAGFELDWIGTGADTSARNRLYIARDVAVLERAFPGLTPARAEETNDRAEYVTSFALTRLRRMMGAMSHEATMRGGLRRQ